MIWAPLSPDRPAGNPRYRASSTKLQRSDGSRKPTITDHRAPMAAINEHRWQRKNQRSRSFNSDRRVPMEAIVECRWQREKEAMQTPPPRGLSLAEAFS